MHVILSFKLHGVKQYCISAIIMYYHVQNNGDQYVTNAPHI